MKSEGICGLFVRHGFRRVNTVIIFATEDTEVTEVQLHAGDDALFVQCSKPFSMRASVSVF